MGVPMFFSALGLDKDKNIIECADGIIDFKEYEYDVIKIKQYILTKLKETNDNITYIHLGSFNRI